MFSPPKINKQLVYCYALSNKHLHDVRFTHLLYDSPMKKMNGLTITIIAPDGVMRSSLRSFLASLPGMQQKDIEMVNIQALDCVLQNPPDIVIVDVDVLYGNAQGIPQLQEMVTQLRTTECATKVILIVNNPDQKSKMEKIGADQVLIKGMLEEPLRRTC